VPRWPRKACRSMLTRRAYTRDGRFEVCIAICCAEHEKRAHGSQKEKTELTLLSGIGVLRTDSIMNFLVSIIIVSYCVYL
jgi:hypothetical protein